MKSTVKYTKFKKNNLYVNILRFYLKCILILTVCSSITPDVGAQAIFCDSFECPVTASDAVEITSNLAALRQVSPPTNTEMVFVANHTSIDDEGGGIFVWFANSEHPDDNGVVVKPELLAPTAPGRWHRQRDKAGSVSVLWFGALREPSEIPPNFPYPTGAQLDAGRAAANARADRTTAAVQDALDSLRPPYGATVYFPAGRYAISETLRADLPSVNVTLTGDGARASQLIAAEGLISSGPMLIVSGERIRAEALPDEARFKDFGGAFPALHIRRLGFLGGVRRYSPEGVGFRTNNAALATAGVRLEGRAFSHDSRLHDVVIENFSERCLDVSGEILGIGIESVSLSGCDYGIYTDSLTTLQAGYAQDLRISSTQTAGVFFANATGQGQPEFMFFSPTFEGNKGPAMILQGAVNIRIVGGHIESNSEAHRGVCLDEISAGTRQQGAFAAAQCNQYETETDVRDCTVDGAIVRSDGTCFVSLSHFETLAGADFLVEPGENDGSGLAFLTLRDTRVSVAGRSLSQINYPLVNALRKVRVMLDATVLGPKRRILYSDAAASGSHVYSSMLPSRLPCVSNLPADKIDFWPDPPANEFVQCQPSG